MDRTQAGLCFAAGAVPLASDTLQNIIAKNRGIVYPNFSEPDTAVNLSAFLLVHLGSILRQDFIPIETVLFLPVMHLAPFYDITLAHYVWSAQWKHKTA